MYVELASEARTLNDQISLSPSSVITTLPRSNVVLTSGSLASTRRIASGEPETTTLTLASEPIVGAPTTSALITLVSTRAALASVIAFVAASTVACSDLRISLARFEPAVTAEA